MKPETLLNLIIRPTLAELKKYDTRPGLDSLTAEVMLVAIAIQESGLLHRKQINGPARSFWQIEPPTALDTLNRYTPAHLFSQDIVCFLQRYTADVSYTLGLNDSFACAIARGILRLRPEKLPNIDNAAAAWQFYLTSWRPGKPRPESWGDAHASALVACYSFPSPDEN